LLSTHGSYNATAASSHMPGDIDLRGDF
jgi:hypothetical protein